MQHRFPLWLALACCLAALAGGVAIGYALFRAPDQRQLASHDLPRAHRHEHNEHEHEHEHDEGEHDEHVDLSAAAANNLGLKFDAIGLSSFRKHLHIPGMVIEKPGQSGLAVTSPIQGIIRQIHKFPGQAISPGDLLFSMQVTDEALETAQLALLETLTRITVAQREFERLEPLAESGAIVGRRKLEIEYQLKQLHSEREARLQELRLRGLSSVQIETIVNSRELVGQIEIRLDIAQTPQGSPSLAAPPADRPAAEGADPVRFTSLETGATDDAGPIYTVEQLDVFPGRAVRKGDELCHVANHHELFLRGEAFEADVPVIRRLEERGWGITAELGDGDGRVTLHDLSVTYMDNHVDPATQTFPVYLAIANRVVAEHRDADGRLFRSWQFKPGQRAHLYIPVQEWTDQIVLPRDAVVRSGPDAFVFRLEDPGYDTAALRNRMASARLRRAAERLARVGDLSEFEMKPVSVHVLHQDNARCVIAQDGRLQVSDIVAMNQAYQIYLAWKLQKSGGGGHDHDH